MTALKKYLGILPLIAFLLIGAPKFALSAYQTSDTLLKEAQNIYREKPLRAIVLAKKALQIAQIKNDKVSEIRSLNGEAKFFWQAHSYDSAKVYAHEALLAAETHRVDSLQGDSWFILGIVDHSMGFYEQAIEKYQRAINLYKLTKLNVKIAKATLDIGICNEQIAMYDRAIKYYVLAATIFESLKDNENLANTYNSIALCFIDLNNYTKCIEYHTKALNIRKKLKDTALIAQSLGNIARAYKQYHHLDSAISYLNRSLDLQKHEKDSSLLVTPLQNLGSSWKIKGDFEKAEYYTQRSLRIAGIYGMNQEMAQGNLDLAELYLSWRRYSQAMTAEKTAEKIAIRLKLPDLLMSAYSIKSILYKQQGDYKNALLYNSKRDTIKDTLLTRDKDKAINELEIKYQTNLKEKDIIALNLQNTLQSKTVGEQRASIIALIIAAILLLALFAITYNNFRIKNTANARIQLLMKDLHHRVKNNLQILSSLFTMQIDSLNDENTKNALRENESRLTSMNLIHSKLYMDDTTTEIEMQEYLTKLLHHIKGSFGGDRERNITLKVDIEPLKIEADKAVAVGLIVNELTTNSFKYAFDDTGGEIFLSLKQPSKSKLLLTIGDNGKGMPDAYEKKSTSFGLKLVKMMARQLSSELKVKNDNGMVYEMEIGV